MLARHTGPQPGSPQPAEAAALAEELVRQGFAHHPHAVRDPARARLLAESVVAAAAACSPTDGAQPERVADYVIPMGDAAARDFQVLHIDFGIPFAPQAPTDIATHTVLYVDPAVRESSAVTRLIPLRQLLAQRSWPDPEAIRTRLVRYGQDSEAASGGGYQEGILARIVEAASGGDPDLPSVTSPGFLCGHEFSSSDQENSFFCHHGLDLGAAEVRVRLKPGELLFFDNLQHAHGRLGRRRPQELHQWVFGFRDLPVDEQQRLVDQVLRSFQ